MTEHPTDRLPGTSPLGERMYTTHLKHGLGDTVRGETRPELAGMYQETAGSRKEVPDSVDDVQAGLGLTSAKHHNSLTGTLDASVGRHQEHSFASGAQSEYDQMARRSIRRPSLTEIDRDRPLGEALAQGSDGSGMRQHLAGGLNPSETRWKEQPVGKAKERKEEDLKGA